MRKWERWMEGEAGDGHQTEMDGVKTVDTERENCGEREFTNTQRRTGESKK